MKKPDANQQMLGTARWLADLMALQVGLPAPHYDFEGRGKVSRRERYLAAVTRGYGQNYEPLAVFFAEAIARRMEGRMMREA